MLLINYNSKTGKHTIAKRKKHVLSLFFVCLVIALMITFIIPNIVPNIALYAQADNNANEQMSDGDIQNSAGLTQSNPDINPNAPSSTTSKSTVKDQSDQSDQSGQSQSQANETKLSITTDKDPSDPSSYNIHEFVTYTITLNNINSTNAVSYSLKSTMSDGITWDSTQTNPDDGSYEVKSNSVSWDNITVAAGASKSVSFRAVINSDALYVKSKDGSSGHGYPVNTVKATKKGSSPELSDVTSKLDIIDEGRQKVDTEQTGRIKVQMFDYTDRPSNHDKYNNIPGVKRYGGKINDNGLREGDEKDNPPRNNDTAAYNYWKQKLFTFYGIKTSDAATGTGYNPAKSPWFEAGDYNMRRDQNKAWVSYKDGSGSSHRSTPGEVLKTVTGSTSKEKYPELKCVWPNYTKAGTTYKSLGYLFGCEKNAKGTETTGVTVFPETTNTFLRYEPNQDAYYFTSCDINLPGWGYIHGMAADYDYIKKGSSATKDDNKFTVYDRPERSFGTTEKRCTEDGTNHSYGDFFPFNSKENAPEISSLPTNEVKCKDGQIHKQAYDYDADMQNIDYWSGLKMTTEFYQYKDGKHPKSDQSVQFTFSGDDDVWIFIDDVLVLDLGGCHGRVAGDINFATGEVEEYFYFDGTETWSLPAKDENRHRKSTIKKRFEEAGKAADQSWKGNTFDDNTHHTMKLYYLERGANVSSCNLMFNLPEEPVGKINLEKQWNDANNRDGLRPSSVDYKLYRSTEADFDPSDDNYFETVSVSGKDNLNTWSLEHQAPILDPKTGKTLYYKVVEDKSKLPEAYDASDPVYPAGQSYIQPKEKEEDIQKVSITNTHWPPDRFDASAEKKWYDNDDSQGLRPNSVELTLNYKITDSEGTEITGIVPSYDDISKYIGEPSMIGTTSAQPQTITNEDWSKQVAWKDLPRYYVDPTTKNRQQITYFVTEKAIGSYVPTYTNNDINFDSENKTITVENNLVTLQKFVIDSEGKVVEHPNAKVGDNIKYKLILHNYGKEEIGSYTLKDVLGTGLKYENSDPDGTYDETSKTISWNSGIIQPNDEFSVIVTCTVTEDALKAPQNKHVINTGKADPPDEETTPPPEVVVDVPIKDVVLTKSTAAEYGTVGQNITYKLTLQNIGAVDLNNYTLKDTLTKGLEYVSSTKEAKVTDKEITWETGPLKANTQTLLGDIFEVEVTCKVTEDALTEPIGVKNTGSAIPGNEDPTPPDVIVDKNVKNIELTKIAKAEDAKVGDEITYTLELKNNGNIDLESYILKDTIAKGLEYVSDTKGGICTDNVITWDTGAINAGSSFSVDVVCKVTKDVLETETKLAHNSGSASPTKPEDPTPPDADTDVKIKAVDVKKTAITETATVGDVIDYKITVSNIGTATIGNYKLVDTLDEALDYIDSDRAAQIEGKTLTWETGELKAGEQFIVKLSCRVNEKANNKDKVVNTAVAHPENPNDPEGNETEVETTITHQAVPTAQTGDNNFLLMLASLITIVASAYLILKRPKRD